MPLICTLLGYHTFHKIFLAVHGNRKKNVDYILNKEEAKCRRRKSWVVAAATLSYCYINVPCTDMVVPLYRLLQQWADTKSHRSGYFLKLVTMAGSHLFLTLY
jgi:hypothetical protein